MFIQGVLCFIAVFACLCFCCFLSFLLTSLTFGKSALWANIRKFFPEAKSQSGSPSGRKCRLNWKESSHPVLVITCLRVCSPSPCRDVFTKRVSCPMVIFHQTGKSCEIWIKGPAARASGLCWDTSGDFPMKGGHDQQKCQCAWKVRSLRMTEISTKISFYSTRQIRTSQPNRIFVTTPVRNVSDRFVYRNAFLLCIHPKVQSCMYAKWDLLLHAHAAFCTETSRVMLLPVSAVPDWFHSTVAALGNE